MIRAWRAWRARNPAASIKRLALWDGIRYLIFIPLFLMYRLRSYGRHNIPAQGPVLLLCNHQSYLDLLAAGVPLAHRHYYAMARKTLFRGFLGKLIRTLNAFEVDQERGDVRAIRRAIELLKNGYLVLIFPEGTRSPDGTVQDFQEGVMLLLRRAKPLVVPAAVEGVYDAWPIHRKRPRLLGRMAVQYGKPIPAEQLLNLPPKEALSRLRHQIDQLRRELRQKMDRPGKPG